ncbi:MAG TPA: hypothetical protein VMT81_00785 [Candidatus Paceibacterota bacterium]|nr:hypothetical protein [Candidatus Paceibacterota bacterium]
MIGIIFIIIGAVLLLESLGVFGSFSGGMLWGIVLLAIGILLMVRGSARRRRRQEWMERRRERRQGQGPQSS